MRTIRYAHLCAIAGLGLLVTACAPPRAPPATIDGYKPPAIFAGFLSPKESRTGCIDAASRYYKVPPQDVTPTSDQQALGGMADSYVVTLSVAGQSHPVNCSVNENGAVSEVVRAP
jgi:hypothetical protein